MKHLAKHCAALNRCLSTMLFGAPVLGGLGSVCLPSWCPSGVPVDLFGEPGEVMAPVHRYLVMCESFLRAEAFSHKPCVMALGKQYCFSEQPEAAVLLVCAVFACQTCELDV